MPRLSDVPKLAKSVGVIAFAKRVWAQVAEDNLFTWAAALAYSWLFAVFPFLLFLLTLIPYLPQRYKQEAKHDIAVVVYYLPKDAAWTVWQNIEPRVDELLNSPPRGVLSLGLIVTLWAAAGG